MSAWLACKSEAIKGRLGKYISIDSGPKATSAASSTISLEGLLTWGMVFFSLENNRPAITGLLNTKCYKRLEPGKKLSVTEACGPGTSLPVTGETGKIALICPVPELPK